MEEVVSRRYAHFSMNRFDIFVKFEFPRISELPNPPTVQDCALRAIEVLESKSKPDDYAIGDDYGPYLTLIFRNREFDSRFKARLGHEH